jgi:hypothetical protein
MREERTSVSSVELEIAGEKMNPLKMIISPARTGRNIFLTIGEMISFNGPGFKR